MIRLLEKLWTLGEFTAAQEHLQRGESPLAVTGLGGVNQSLFAAAAANAMNCPIVWCAKGIKKPSAPPVTLLPSWEKSRF